MMFFSGIPCKVIVFWGWHGNHWIRSCHGISFKELLGKVAQYVLWSEATSFPWSLPGNEVVVKRRWIWHVYDHSSEILPVVPPIRLYHTWQVTGCPLLVFYGAVLFIEIVTFMFGSTSFQPRDTTLYLRFFASLVHPKGADETCPNLEPRCLFF